MKILVLGGNGFIGSHLVDRLLRDNHDVLKKFDVLNIYLDNSRARTELSWRPKTDLHQGLSKTWEFIKKIKAEV
ncbi:MAG: NAD-dependent epimerase/dehydratase family protein [Smithella sp.]|jgi:nucleoside-diphosphate-sugar epimerase